MDKKIQIRLRTPSGQERVEISEQAHLGDLVRIIKEKTGLIDINLKYGYPLKNLNISLDAQEQSIRDLQLRGETIVVAPIEPPPQSTGTMISETKNTTAPNPPNRFVPKGVEADETVLEWNLRGGYMVLRVMPDDNSCMFTAVGGALKIDNPAQLLRQQVAEYILRHPDKYNEAILGEDPVRYTSRMMQMDTWGGAIELSILSDIYQVEISSIDVKSLRVDQFGEGMDTRIIILYSGIHYDRIAFCLDISHPTEVDETKWSTNDELVLKKARELAQQLQRVHYYTDTTDFVIKCAVCDWIGQGTREATKHEKETGHSQFGEMEIQ